MPTISHGTREGTTWAKLAARGADIRHYTTSKRRSVTTASSYPLVGSVVYEDEDYIGRILATKAMKIMQQSLTPGSVLFTFRKGLFGDRVDAYPAIQTQISRFIEFRPLSIYDSKDDGSLFIEAKFEEADDAKKAIQTATFKGAPPVCHFCRHSGHICAKCPELARRRCFGCHKPGHIIKFCPKSDKQRQQADFVESVYSTGDLSDYADKEKLGDSEAESADDEDFEDPPDNEKVDNVESVASENENDNQRIEDHMQEDEDEEDKVIVAGDVKTNLASNSAHSKYAPITVAMSMKVDKPEELATDAALREASKKKQAEFHSKLYGSTSAAGTTGSKSKGTTGKNTSARKTVHK
ncbi:hypothetical protein [Parasitella parasitica]|uniref:CCHC-type domain-containing protein n=1 Tax=Parasitella parasitica TaxID=35722 RepID=A0A0B7NNF1_9FUNG|nr:hypothetical protein [Parasitella parasitica]